MCDSFFFFNDTATTEIYTLSLHDALPIYECLALAQDGRPGEARLEPLEDQAFVKIAVVMTGNAPFFVVVSDHDRRSEEHTSELQSYLVCRLLLEKKKKKNNIKLQSIYILT